MCTQGLIARKWLSEDWNLPQAVALATPCTASPAGARKVEMIPACEGCICSWWHWAAMALSGRHSVVWHLVQAGDRGWTVQTDVLPGQGMPHGTLRAPITLSLCEGCPRRCAGCGLHSFVACLSGGCVTPGKLSDLFEPQIHL